MHGSVLVLTYLLVNTDSPINFKDKQTNTFVFPCSIINSKGYAGPVVGRLGL